MIVAVVEDFEGLRVAIGRLLRAAGYEIALFDSAEANLAAPPTNPVCLVLDMHLRGMSGLDLQRHLRSGQSAPVPIILTTADPSFRDCARDLGCDALLIKPLPNELLLTTIASFVRRSTDGGGSAP